MLLATSPASAAGDGPSEPARAGADVAGPSEPAQPADLPGQEREYRNPILRGFYPDPSVVRVADDYYLVTSSFEYFPGIPIFHSRDLVHWRQLGHVLTRRSQLSLARARSSGGVFAPTIRHHDGTFYVITTNVGPGTNFYVTATDPAGPWSEPIVVNEQGMDPSLLFLGGSADEPLRVFYTSQLGRGTTSHIVQAEIDPSSGKLKGDLLPIWRGTGGPWTEGPHLYAIDGQYYLLAAEGGTRAKHSAVIARSSQPQGPFVPYEGNPIASHRGAPGEIQNVGHADLVQTSAGQWFAVLLGVRARGTPALHVLGRETFLAPVQWANGWPSLGERGRIAEVMRGALPTPHPYPAPEPRDDFEGDELGFEWNFLRNPPMNAWSLTQRSGWLRLHGNAATLDDVAAPAFVGRRQQHRAFRASTRLAFTPRIRGNEAGLALRMTERHHCEIAIRPSPSGRIATLRLRNGDKRRELASAKLPRKGAVKLHVASDGERYFFGYSLGNGVEQPLSDIPVGLLSSELSGSLTGVYIALWASGSGKPSTTAADFDWFEYAPR